MRRLDANFERGWMVAMTMRSDRIWQNRSRWQNETSFECLHEPLRSPVVRLGLPAIDRLACPPASPGRSYRRCGDAAEPRTSDPPPDRNYCPATLPEEPEHPRAAAFRGRAQC